MKRLTPEQQQLVTDHLVIAKCIAMSLCRNEYARRDSDEIFSASMWGLCVAAVEWDGVKKWTTFAPIRARMRTIDVLRGTCGRRVTKKGPASSKYLMGLASQFADNSEGEPGEWDISSGDKEVGWEIESEDEVCGKLKYLDPKYRRVMLVTYLNASYTPKGLAGNEGVSSMTICTWRNLALEFLRKGVTCG